MQTPFEQGFLSKASTDDSPPMSLLTRILLLAKNPALGIGAVMVILAFVEDRGTSFSPTTHPSYPLGIFGAVVFTVGLIHSLREGPVLESNPRFKDAVFYDASFWHKLFDAMPPVFVQGSGRRERRRRRRRPPC
jgi:hypothetical protein